MFPGGNIKISNVLKISSYLCRVLLGLRYQGNGSYINLSVFFSSKQNGSGWAQKVIDETLPATAPSAHNNINICLKFFHGEVMAQWENHALIDLRVEGLNLVGQLLIYFHSVFPVLTKTLCRHASLVPKSRIKAFMSKLQRCSPQPSAPLLFSIVLDTANLIPVLLN